jgi:hypothetical protein
MKKIYYLVSVVFLLNSCSKEKINNSNIPTFENKVELSKKIDYLNSLEENDRVDFENQKNKISLKTYTFNELRNLEIEESKSIDEIKRKIQNKSEYLNLSLDENNEYFIDFNYGSNVYSLVANKDRLFAISDSVYKVFNDGILATRLENIEGLKAFKSPNLPDHINEFYKAYLIKMNKIELKNGLPNYGSEIWRTVERDFNRTRLFLMTNVKKNIFEDSETFEAYGEVVAWRRMAFVWTRVERTFDGYVDFYGSYTFGSTLLDFSCQGSLKTNSAQFSKKVEINHMTKGTVNGLYKHDNIKIHGSNSWAQTPSTGKVSIILN